MRLTTSDILGAKQTQAMLRARNFLLKRSPAQLLPLVGKKIPQLAVKTPFADKSSFPTSYGGRKPTADDLLAASGPFYVTESGKLFLDCTSGHYQMSWGYNHPELSSALADALRIGIVWDNHANIPSLPVKLLTERLVAVAKGSGLDRVLLGVCTGSIACGAALKIMLIRHSRDKSRAKLGPPVMVVLDGNYHGTEVATQVMRGMWPGLVTGMKTVTIEPNDNVALRKTFARYGKRIAGFWAEPIMMNREVIIVNANFLKLAGRLCAKYGAIFCLDEIQTGFWYPEVFLFRRLGLSPDIVVLGKGMTAGFHPLAGLLYKHELDIFEQYDSISTNGNASLASFIGLCNLSLIEKNRACLKESASRHEAGLRKLAARFPKIVESVNGSGFLTGLKFRNREDAIGFHKSALERGLWLRVHAYHPGHRTILYKLPLAMDRRHVDFVLGATADLLARTPWR